MANRWWCQRRPAQAVINDVTVTPAAAPERVAAQIEEAFEREAGVDARHVRVEVSDHTARLYGHVHSVNEANVATAAPGVAKVENHLVVSP
jgi:osmotically-inducible protein OsmY